MFSPKRMRIRLEDARTRQNIWEGTAWQLMKDNDFDPEVKEALEQLRRRGDSATIGGGAGHPMRVVRLAAVSGELVMSTLRDRVIRLAYNKPHLRSHLLPLLKQAVQLSDIDVEEGKMHKILGLDMDQNISEYGSPSAATQKLVSEVGEDEAASMINWAANISGDLFLKDMQDALKEIE